MNILARLSPYPLHPIQMGLFILIELQLIFGRYFAKFHLFGPIHLYDLLFFALGIWSIITIIKRDRPLPLLWPLIALITFSVGYLLYSIIVNIGPLNYIIRHYALFMYLFFSFFIFYSFIDEERHEINLKFLWLIAILALIAQLLTHLYNFFTIDNYQAELFKRFNYMSEMIMPGMIILIAWILCYIKDWKYKYALAIAVLFVSTTLGYASAFLACFVPVLVYFYFLLRMRFMIFMLLTSSFLLLFFIVLPQFNDANALWRVLYWREILKDGIISYYGILGHGFGGSFITDSINQAFLSELHSIHFDVNPEEKFLTPMHNSFITIMFHLGILPGLLVFFPLKEAFNWMKTRRENRESHRVFIILSLTGFIIWVCFNVILELPHSSAFFWLIYFTAVNEFSDDKQKTIKLGFKKS